MSPIARCTSCLPDLGQCACAQTQSVPSPEAFPSLLPAWSPDIGSESIARFPLRLMLSTSRRGGMPTGCCAESQKHTSLYTGTLIPTSPSPTCLWSPTCTMFSTTARKKGWPGTEAMVCAQGKADSSDDGHQAYRVYELERTLGEQQRVRRQAASCQPE